MTVIGVVAFATNGLCRGVEVRRYNLETADGEPEGESYGGKPDALATSGKRVAVERGLVKRVKPGAPEEQIGEL